MVWFMVILPFFFSLHYSTENGFVQWKNGVGTVSKVISDKFKKALDKLHKNQMLQLYEAQNF